MCLQIFTKPPGRIDITPQSFIPGAKIVKYIGSYNFFFIRETTSNREVHFCLANIARNQLWTWLDSDL